MFNITSNILTFLIIRHQQADSRSGFYFCSWFIELFLQNGKWLVAGLYEPPNQNWKLLLASLQFVLSSFTRIYGNLILSRDLSFIRLYWKWSNLHVQFDLINSPTRVISGFTLNYSGPYFSAFGLNTERYEVSLRINLPIPYK